MHLLEGYLRAGGSFRRLLRVTVEGPGADVDGILPPMLGQYDRLADGMEFRPAFPFGKRSVYCARFDPQPMGDPGFSAALTLAFSLSNAECTEATDVTDIFPSSEELPENLLRFYVTFSGPMQRGHARTAITLVGPDGGAVPDVLYRAPTELWDRGMRRLTILLDPGRLKRGVGPNRTLGPPLQAGNIYTLVVGTQMADLAGRPLAHAVRKCFRATPAIREAIAADHWQIVPPEAGSRQQLTIAFPRPLDQALLPHALRVVSSAGRSIAGQINIGQNETQWSLTPNCPWAGGAYHVEVDINMEDVCGNTLLAAFDRPLRASHDRGGAISRRARRDFSVAVADPLQI
jgi:hypothetical protein